MIEIYKGYQVKPNPKTPTSYIVVTDGKGGKVPDVLTSLFTTSVYAKAAIDKYLDSKPVKEVKNGKEVDKG
jgi:hypothetical protein